MHTRKRTITLVLIGVIVLCTIGLLSQGDLASRLSASLGVRLTRPGEENSLSNPINKTVRPEDNKEISTDSYVKNSMVSSPFSVEGVNPWAKDYYHLTESEAQQASKVASDLRLEIATKIADGLESVKPGELPNDRGATEIWRFKTSPELAAQIESKLINALQPIGGEEFANASAKALRADSKFLGGLKTDVVFLLHPSVSRDGGPLPEIRIEWRGTNGKIGPYWEGPMEEIKTKLLIDFAPTADK